jgi:hypothetical protein
VGCVNLCRYQIIERANALAEVVAPRAWSATTQPLCAFVRSSRLFFYLPSTATAFSALAAACSQEMMPALRVVAAAVATKEQVGWAAQSQSCSCFFKVQPPRQRTSTSVHCTLNTLHSSFDRWYHRRCPLVLVWMP